jgi:hypothetical protein
VAETVIQVAAVKDRNRCIAAVRGALLNGSKGSTAGVPHSRMLTSSRV